MRRLAATAVAVALGAVMVDRLLARRETIAGRRVGGAVQARVAVLADRWAAWRVLADVEGQVRWMHDAKAIRALTPGPVGVGSRLEADVRIFGLGTTDVVEVTAWDPPERVALRHLGAFKGTGEIRLEATGEERTVITWEERLVAPLLPHLAASVMGPVLQRVFQADLQRLAVLILEEGAAAEAQGSAEATGLEERA